MACGESQLNNGFDSGAARNGAADVRTCTELCSTVPLGHDRQNAGIAIIIRLTNALQRILHAFIKASTLPLKAAI